MKLFEFEGHKVLASAGIESPAFIVCETAAQVKAARTKLKFPVVAKVQVLSGGRGKAGGVQVCSREAGLLEFAKEFLGKEFPPRLARSSGEAGHGEKVKYILLAQKASFEAEYYVSITYDTALRKPFLMFSEKGGMEIEEVARQNPEEVIKIYIDPVAGPAKGDFKKFPVSFEFATKLWEAFSKNDCRLLEINPLAKTEGGKFLALDAKVILDDNGLGRHEDFDFIPKGAITAAPSERELAAKKIDEGDYRGSAGSAFLDLAGDIAILASGGGASLLVMDSVAAAGGKPANYTEYSGNPSREKVEKLTRIALSRPRLSGCLVAGAVANFTDIYETLAGFADGLKSVKPKVSYPIVVRRGGPRQEEAYKMLKTLAKREGFDIHLFGPQTPISAAAREMVELSEKYKSKSKSKV
ncbi:MAG: ATP citrate lyase citrate-binding domain-containing protein [Candidatus Curtissbacteria bacterium]|nr:ATP citrate lyase citrate-binding domain-containing protein [Candidatus Curtissbacteria bacterium]